jgi:leader peptidase (prepilin peptidase) / N-methyltransferase
MTSALISAIRSGLDARVAPSSSLWFAGGIGAVLGATAGYTRGPMAAAVSAAFFAALAAGSLIDIRERRLPNALTLVGTVLALLAAALAGAVVSSLAGTLLAGGVMATAWVASRGRLGLGDVKLCLFSGAVLGPRGAVLFLMFGTAAGALMALLLLASGRARWSDTLAYGPYLALGAAISACLAGPLVH